MSYKRSLFGFAFEGYGTDTSKAGGDCFYFGNNAPASSTLNYIPALKRIPKSISTSVNPFTGSWKTSAFTVELDGSDRVATALMSIQRRATLRLATAIDSVATTVVVQDSTGTPVTTLSGQAVFLGDETILLGAHTLGGSYPATRGFYSSPAQAHGVNASIFTRVPFWQGRIVRLVEQEIDADGGLIAERVRWRGVFDDVEQDGPNVAVRTAELLTSLQSVERNVDSPNFGKAVLIPASNGSGRQGTPIGFINQVPRVPASDLRVAYTAAVQIDEAIVGLRAQASTNSLDVSASRILFDSDLDQESQPKFGERGFELFAIERDPANELTGGFNSLRGILGASGVPSDLNLPFHPIVISLALMTSTGTGENGNFDVLSEDWGLRIDYIDLSAWEAAILAEPGLKIDRLVLGWDGDPVNILKTVQEILLRPFGYFLTVNVDGALSIDRLRLPELQDLVDADSISPYPDPGLKVRQALPERSSEVVAEVGKLPFREGSRLAVRDGTITQRAASLTNTIKHELDLQVIDPSRVGDLARVSSELATTLISLLAIGLDAAPRLDIRVADYVVTSKREFNLGRLFTLSDLGGLRDAWLVSPDGERVNVTQEADLIPYSGFVIARQWDLEDHSYNLTLLLLGTNVGGFVRWRAPAAALASDGAGLTTLTLDVTGPYGTTPGRQFTGGDQVSVWSTDGVPFLQSTVVQGVTDTTIDVLPTLSTAPAGAIIRLSPSDTYDNPLVTNVTSRSYTFISDGSLLEPTFTGVNVDGPDFYGTRVTQAAAQQSPASQPAFTGIDEASIEVVGGVAQPLDAWLAYTMRDNAARLVVDGGQISWVPVTANAGDLTVDDDHRPYASVRPSSILYIPWIIEPGLKSVKLTMSARVGTESLRANDIDDALQVRASLDVARKVETLANSQASSPPFQDIQFDLTFDQTRTARAIRQLKLEVLSQPGETVEADASGAVFQQGNSIVLRPEDPAGGDQNYLAVSPLASRPTANGGDTEAIMLLGSDVTRQSGAVDWLHYDNYAIGAGASFDVAFVRAAVSSANVVQRVETNYLQTRGIEIAQTFVDYAYPTDDALESGKPALGEGDVTAPLRTFARHQRVRPLWVGPTGDRPGSAAAVPWPDGYTQRFVRERRDNTPRIFFEALVWPETVNPRIVALLNVLPVHLVPEQAPANQDQVTSNLSTAGWRFWYDLQQLQDGGTDYSGATSIFNGSTDKQQRDLLHWPTFIGAENAAILNERLTEFTLQTWGLKEGQLYREDQELVDAQSPIAVSYDITYDPAVLDRPMRLRLWAENDGTDAEFGVQLNQRNDALYLVLVGASIWEVPQ